VADFVVTSLGLSFKAKETAAENVILFCGVHFNGGDERRSSTPARRSFLPDLEAGCFAGGFLRCEAGWRAGKLKGIRLVIVATQLHPAVKVASESFVHQGNAVWAGC